MIDRKPTRHLKHVRRLSIHKQMETFMRALVTTIDYCLEHDADALPGAMRDAAQTARAILDAEKAAS